MDDSASDKNSVVIFMVYGDGRRLAQSPPLKWGDEARTLERGRFEREPFDRTNHQACDGPSVTWGEAALTGRQIP